MAISAGISIDQIKAEMASTNELFNKQVFGKRNFDALEDIYTEDARILPPGSRMISGRQAITKFWSEFIKSVNAKSALLTSIDIVPAGDDVLEIGEARLAIEPEGQPAAEIEVKYVVYWRQENARWKWHVDIWNPNS